MKTINAIVSGRVQGVGYRSFVISSACSLGIRGSVKNNRDSTVTIICQGEEGALERFFARINVRDSSIRVESIEKREVKKPKEYQDFRVEFSD